MSYQIELKKVTPSHVVEIEINNTPFIRLEFENQTAHASLSSQREYIQLCVFVTRKQWKSILKRGNQHPFTLDISGQIALDIPHELVFGDYAILPSSVSCFTNQS